MQHFAVSQIASPHAAEPLRPTAAGGKRMLVAVLKQDETSWFFKLLAPADVVARQQAAFEAFVKSVRFDAGKGAQP